MQLLLFLTNMSGGIYEFMHTETYSAVCHHLLIIFWYRWIHINLDLRDLSWFLYKNKKTKMKYDWILISGKTAYYD